MPYDILIKNGTIVDGSGMPSYRGDVGIRDGRIVERGNLSGGALKIDAEGLVVAPGFIDMHTHYDCQLLWDPLATSSCWHGVTTVVTGNCGYSLAPGGSEQSDYLMRLMARVESMHLDVLRTGIEWDWTTFPEFMARLERSLGVNVAPLLGHSALRYYVIGPESYERASTEAELETMRGILREAMRHGAAGFSTDQSKNHVGGYGEPVPSRMGTWDELVDLAGVVGEFNRGVLGVSPYPGGGDIPQEFREVMIRMAATSRRPVLWNSLMHRWDQPHLYKDLMQFMDQASAEGCQIYAMGRSQRMDLEFNLRSTAMFDLFPAWRDTIALPQEEKVRMLQDQKTRAKLREEWDTRAAKMSSRNPKFLRVSQVAKESNQGLVGKRLVDIAAERGGHVVDTMLDIALDEDLGTQFVYLGTMNGDEAAVGEIVAHEHAIPGTSDGGAHVDMECAVDFTDVLLGKWVRDRGVLSLEDAVHRLTFKSASLLGLTDRGLLREGMAADVVIFDAESIAPTDKQMVSDLPGGGRRLIQRSDVVKTVIVNGQVLLQDGNHSGALPGRVVTRNGDA